MRFYTVNRVKWTSLDASVLNFQFLMIEWIVIILEGSDRTFWLLKF